MLGLKFLDKYSLFFQLKKKLLPLDRVDYSTHYIINIFFTVVVQKNSGFFITLIEGLHGKWDIDYINHPQKIKIYGHKLCLKYFELLIEREGPNYHKKYKLSKILLLKKI